jgi:hypothetical protein
MSAPKLSAYVPSLPKLSQEVIAVLVGTIVAAWIISRWPAAQRLVRSATVPSPLDQP